MGRVELNEENVENVVGGAFNFYYDAQGVKSCFVDGVGDFSCTVEATDRLSALKLQHKRDRWTAQQYVDVLVDEGLFFSK